MKTESKNYYLSVKEYNRMMMRRAIYLCGPLTRSSLASQLGVSLPTVTTSVALMLEEGILIEEPYAGRPYGRPAQQIDFRPDARFAVGIDVSEKQMCGCLCNLRGGICKTWEAEPIPDDYEAMLDRMEEQIRLLIQEVPAELLLGGGIAFNDNKYSVRTDKNGKSWDAATLKKELSARLGIRFHRGNDIRMRAIGRAMFGRCAPLTTFAYLYVSRRIVCPIVNNHRFMAAVRVTVGRIGHNIVQSDAPEYGVGADSLDATVGENALCRNGQKLVQEGRAPHLAKMLKDGRTPNLSDLLKARRAGDEAVAQMLDKAIKMLALIASNVVNLIELDFLTVDGNLFSLPEHRELMENEIRAHLFDPNAPVDIEFLDYDGIRGAQGAAAYVIHETFLTEPEMSLKDNAEEWQLGYLQQKCAINDLKSKRQTRQGRPFW